MKLNDGIIRQKISESDNTNREYFSVLYGLIDGKPLAPCFMTISENSVNVYLLSPSDFIVKAKMEFPLGDIKKIKNYKFIIWLNIKIILNDNTKLKVQISKKVLGLKLQTENFEKFVDFLQKRYK